MLFTWMIYVTVVSALAAIGAWALERATRTHKLSTRWIWLAAVGTSMGMAGYAALPRVGETLAAQPTTAIPTPDALVPIMETVSRITTPTPVPDWNTFLMIGWSVLSALMVFVILRSALALLTERASWSRASVNGREVMVSESLGPAVVGFIRSTIVVPRWALTMDPDDRELMLRHEEEHRKAGDAWLLATSVVLVAAMPWNPALWWQAHRLRLALEIDCDRRVLRDHSGLRRYAELLLDMSERTTISRMGVLAFARPAPFLERRIRTMTDKTRPRILRTLGLVALAVTVTLGACEVTLPSLTSPEQPAGNLVRTYERTDGTNFPFLFQMRSEQGGVVTGRISDKGSGLGIESVQVFLPDLNMGGLTNQQGRFLLLNVPEGEHRMVLKKGGGFGEHTVEGIVALGGERVTPLLPLRPRMIMSRPDGTKAVFTGTITHPVTGEPLAGVQVFLTDLNMGGLTNTKGTFLLLNVPPGTHTLRLEHPDFPEIGAVELQVTGVAGETTQIGSVQYVKN